MWRCKTRKRNFKRIISDPHSPPIFRVNGILGNIDDFYKIYKIKKIMLYGLMKIKEHLFGRYLNKIYKYI